MTFFEAIRGIFDPLLEPLLQFPPIVAIGVISVFVAIFSTLVYKFTTNQKALKTIKEEMAQLRSQIKKAEDKARAAELNKQVMERSFQQMRHSMKSMFFTIIPLILIFGWMQANVAFLNVEPGENFTTTVHFEKGAEGTVEINPGVLALEENSSQAVADAVTWTLSGPEGTHEIEYVFGDEVYARKVIITDSWEYSDPLLEKPRFLRGDAQPIRKDSKIHSIMVNLEQVHPFGGISLFGWRPGWLGAYILLSIILTFPLRKMLKVH